MKYNIDATTRIESPTSSCKIAMVKVDKKRTEKFNPKYINNFKKGLYMNYLNIFRKATLFLMLDLVLTLLGVVFNQVTAQTIQDVVYLKNGSIIKGNIIEQIIGKNLKIETRDGNLFVFKMDEIEKIGKNSPQVQSVNSTPVQNPAVKSRQKYDEGVTEEMPQVSNNSRTRFGASLGIFSIDLNNFDDIYESSSGTCYGVNFDWGVSSTYSSVVRFKYFSKAGKPIGDMIMDGTASWKEYWILLGGRLNINTNSQVTPYVGSGLTFVSVSEELSATMYSSDSYYSYSYQQGASFNKTTIGFSLMGGFSIALSNRVYLDTDLEYTIANMKGEGGVGGNDLNVGGLFIGAGLHFGL
jgi:opacity protein-like surface antigen